MLELEAAVGAIVVAQVTDEASHGSVADAQLCVDPLSVAPGG
jgi:hypothetical protein